MYEALLREGMDAEQSDKFDEALEEASGTDRAQAMADRIARMREMGAQIG